MERFLVWPQQIFDARVVWWENKRKRGLKLPEYMNNKRVNEAKKSKCETEKNEKRLLLSFSIFFYGKN